MIRKLAAFSALVFALTGMAQADTITFDSNGSDFFQFNNWEVFRLDGTDRNLDFFNADYEVSGFKSMSDALSVEWVAGNQHLSSDAFFSTADPTSVQSGQPFALNSLWLASGYGKEHALVITAQDAHGDIIYTRSLSINTRAQEYTFEGWTGISALLISTYAADNVFVKADGVSPDNNFQSWLLGSMDITQVPEPETYAMLLAGLAVLGAVARRRRD
jgi:hypothetical protein